MTHTELTKELLIEDNEVNCDGKNANFGYFLSGIWNLNNIKCKAINLRRIHFAARIRIENVNLSGGIHIKDCVFESGIQLNSIGVGFSENLSNPKDLIVSSLVIENCDLRNGNVVIESECKFSGIVIIKNCINLGSLIVNDSKFSSFSFGFNKVEIGNISFGGNEISHDLRYESNEINGQIRHQNNSYGGLVFLDNIMKKDIFIKDTRVENNITFNNGIFEDSVTIDPYFAEFESDPNNNEFESSNGEDSKLSFFGTDFKKEVKVNYHKEIGDKNYYGGCRSIFVGANRFLFGLYIEGLNFDVPFRAFKLKELSLKVSSDFEGFLKIRNFDIAKIEISGENRKGNFSLKNISAGKLIIDSFTNYDNFQFINCQALIHDKQSKLSISDSYLEKTYFINCVLNDFESYWFRNNILSGIKSANTKWFDVSSINFSFDRSSEEILKNKTSEDKNRIIARMRIEHFEQTRELFRQLKYAMESQGDRIESLRFKSFEMSYYHTYLKESKSWFDKDRIIMLAGSTNEYGLDWKKALKLLLISISFFYVLILLTASNRIWSQPVFPGIFIPYPQALFCKFSIWLELINPTSSLDKVLINENVAINSLWLLIIEVLRRITLAFFIFQIISAFRKYVK